MGSSARCENVLEATRRRAWMQGGGLGVLVVNARSNRQSRAREVLAGMAVKGYCIIEEMDSGLRIGPPAGWGASYSGWL